MRKRRNMKLRVKNLIEKYNTSNPYVLCERLRIEIKYVYYKDVKGFFLQSIKKKIHCYKRKIR